MSHLTGVLALTVAVAASATVPGEAILEGRLLAPCCYTQTLDVHESPMATELRAEIRSRLTAGESPRAIENDFAERYGERVRAVPRDREPRAGAFLVAVTVMVAAGIALGALVRRWRRTPSEPRPALAAGRDELDDRIDDELRD